LTQETIVVSGRWTFVAQCDYDALDRLA
jgi:hypothetical protein